MSFSFSYAVSRVLQKIMNPSAIRNSKLGKCSSVGKSCQIVDTIIGNYSYVSSSCAIVSADIGSFCSIASRTVIGGAGHPTNWVSTSPVFQNVSNACGINFSKLKYEPYKRTIIGNDVWIGNGCLIKSGIHIADGAVIGMGSVVTHDIPAYAIVAGVPARIVRYRFDESTIDKLLATDWFNLSEHELKKRAEFMNDIDKFIDTFELRGEN